MGEGRLWDYGVISSYYLGGAKRSLREICTWGPWVGRAVGCPSYIFLRLPALIIALFVVIGLYSRRFLSRLARNYVEVHCLPPLLFTCFNSQGIQIPSSMDHWNLTCSVHFCLPSSGGTYQHIQQHSAFIRRLTRGVGFRRASEPHWVSCLHPQPWFTHKDILPGGIRHSFFSLHPASISSVTGLNRKAPHPEKTMLTAISTPGKATNIGGAERFLFAAWSGLGGGVFNGP